MSSLNSFPARVAIGRVTDSAGKDCIVYMTPEFSRAISGLADAVSSAEVAALRVQVDQLEAELAAATGIIEQIQDLQVVVAMNNSQREIIKGTATGSRAANAALASLLTALARSGLVIDNTTV